MTQTRDIEQLAQWLHHQFDTEHLSWAEESEPGREYYRKMARAQVAEVPAQVEEAARAAEPVDSTVPDLAEKLRRVWMSGTPIEPGGRIDWTRFAQALVHDEGVRPR